MGEQWLSKICPLPMITEESREFLRLYDWFVARVLPFGGGLYDQPRIFMQAMEIIQTRRAKVDADRAEENGDT